jgi:hypothetical protein
MYIVEIGSIADPDPGSGAFLPLCPPDPGWAKIRIRIWIWIRDEQTRIIFPRAEKPFFWVKRVRDNQPGSATLEIGEAFAGD